MSCGCEQIQICVGGNTYNADVIRDARGNVISATYIDQNLALVSLAPGSFTFGECSNETENEVLSGTGVPAAAPADPLERKLWINSATNKITHWWDPVTGTWKLLTPIPDVFRVVQPLVSGNNVITHNLGIAPVEVEVRNQATGAFIATNTLAETINTVTIFVPVAVASVRISIDA